MHMSESKKKENSEITDAEWDILKVVWQQQPCAAGNVQEALQQQRNWAYSTVKTTMDRMVKKGILKISKIRNLQLFSANITESQAKRSEILKTIKRAFDGALTPMMQFLLENEQWSKKELQQLKELVDKSKPK